MQLGIYCYGFSTKLVKPYEPLQNFGVALGCLFLQKMPFDMFSQLFSAGLPEATDSIPKKSIGMCETKMTGLLHRQSIKISKQQRR